MIRNTNKSSYFKTSKCGKNVKIDNLAIFSVGIKNKEGADSEEAFNAATNIAGVKLRARATGTLNSANLISAASVR